MESQMFSYAMAKVFAPVRTMAAMSGLMFFAAVAFAVFGADDGQMINYIGFIAMVIAGALAVFWVPITILLVLGNGGISFDEDGVATYLLGRRYRKIHWSEIKRVAKVTFLDKTMGANRTEFWLETEKVRVGFNDYLKRYSSAVDSLNAYVEKYKIPGFEYDHGVKSNAARFLIAATSAGPSQNVPRPGEVGKPVSSFSA